MTKRITTILGVLLFLLGIISLLLLWQDRAAAGRMDRWSFDSNLADDSCHAIVQRVSLPRRVMTEKESQTLQVSLSNIGTVTCHTVVRLAALDFEVTPAAIQRVVALEPQGAPVTILWILKPREVGSFEVAVSTGAITEVLGIVVTNVLGFTAVQVQILSSISSLLGPMLTVPWWYEQWEKRKRARKEEAEKAAAAQAAVNDGGGKTPARDFRPE